LDIAVWQQLREENQPPHVERHSPIERSPEPQWPRLTPSGIEPDPDMDEILHRTHV
jgi:hypothetical protein